MPPHVFGDSSYGQYPSVSFDGIGNTCSGRIVDISYFRNSPDARFTLEQTPGDESSRVNVWTNSAHFRRAIAQALCSVAELRPQVGAYLTITLTDYDGRAKVYEATYSERNPNEVLKVPGF